MLSANVQSPQVKINVVNNVVPFAVVDFLFQRQFPNATQVNAGGCLHILLTISMKNT